MKTCPSDNADAIDQSSFWSAGTPHWDAHRIGWAVAGGSTVVTLMITVLTVLSHCRNYTNPRHQRQIIRILYMPLVYAIISFLSYRFFRDYTYYSFIEVVYEAITLSAFLLLLIEFVADGRIGHREDLLAHKDKRKLVFPFCFWRYRPTKPYFMYTVKWSVLQYVIVRPLVSIVGIICQALAILCESEGFNPHFASVYLEAIDFVSISVALYGLLIFYGLTKEELEGKRPLAKFLCIKLIVMFTFYQSFVFSALQSRVIHATNFWTATNISNGLNALTICIEMIFFAALMGWAYPYHAYKRAPDTPPTRIWTPLWDSINYSDFAREIIGSLTYFLNRKKYESQMAARLEEHRPPIPTFGSAFSIEGHGNKSGRRHQVLSRSSEDIPLATPHSTEKPSQSDENSRLGEVRVTQGGGA